MDKFVKDPEAVLDYTWDWSDFLAAGETITAHAVVTDLVEPELTIDSAATDTASVTAWLSGGAVGEQVLVTCRITTSAARTDDRSIYVLVSER